MDSAAKLTSEDWHLDANCANFEQHRDFFTKIYEINQVGFQMDSSSVFINDLLKPFKELLQQRNKLDSQLRNETEMNSITGLLSSMKSYVK